MTGHDAEVEQPRQRALGVAVVHAPDGVLGGEQHLPDLQAVRGERRGVVGATSSPWPDGRRGLLRSRGRAGGRPARAARGPAAIAPDETSTTCAAGGPAGGEHVDQRAQRAGVERARPAPVSDDEPILTTTRGRRAQLTRGPVQGVLTFTRPHRCRVERLHAVSRADQSGRSSRAGQPSVAPASVQTPASRSVHSSRARLGLGVHALLVLAALLAARRAATVLEPQVGAARTAEQLGRRSCSVGSQSKTTALSRVADAHLVARDGAGLEQLRPRRRAAPAGPRGSRRPRRW